MSALEVKVFDSMEEIAPEVWDGIAAGRGFQSHRWYMFGERAMSDSKPTYLIAYDGDKARAAAALFRVRNEPLPLTDAARQFMESVFKQRPLLICRSPFANTSALLLPGEPLRDEALTALAQAAQKQLKKQRCSFLVFDFMLTEQLKYAGWPSGFEPVAIAELGTYMPIEWENFATYLESENDKRRQYYKKSAEEVEKYGLVLSRHTAVSDIDTAVRLIGNVSIWQGSALNPWMRGLLENFEMADGTWLELRKDDKLVGCAAVLRDNKFQLVTALGLEDDVPGGYFYLLYVALQEAFEHKIRLVRFGTGSYDIKRELGLHLEDTNHAMLAIPSVKTRAAKTLAAG